MPGIPCRGDGIGTSIDPNAPRLPVALAIKFDIVAFQPLEVISTHSYNRAAKWRFAVP
jgi:hypothetical protein